MLRQEERKHKKNWKNSERPQKKKKESNEDVQYTSHGVKDQERWSRSHLPISYRV